MVNKTVIIFHDDKDQDIQLGLSFLWEALKLHGCTTWYKGSDVYQHGFNIEPCDIILINTVLPQEMMTLLHHQGFNIVFIGNAASPKVTFANTLNFDVTIIDNNAAISALLFTYYIYLEHKYMGNRLDFLPVKVVSDDLSFIYNNNLTELLNINLVKGVYINGINGPLFKQNIGSAVLYNPSLNGRLLDLEKDKGNLYV